MAQFYRQLRLLDLCRWSEVCFYSVVIKIEYLLKGFAVHKIVLRLMVSLTFVISFVGCSSNTKNSKAEPKWISNMHQLSDVHSKLTPIVADSKKFSDPDQKRAINENLKRMVEISAAIASDSRAPNADPLIGFNAQKLVSEVNEAYSAFQVQDLPRSQFAFSRISSSCISCHTRADRGFKDFPLPWENNIKSLSKIQRVELMMANRQYKSAIAEAFDLASDPKVASQDPRAWLVTLERSLGLLIRVYKDPTQAEALVSYMLKNKSAPFYVKSDAVAWQKDIKTWKTEKSRRKVENFDAAKKYFEQAAQAGPRDSVSLIKYLRASGILHELMENTKSPQYAEYLLYSGMIASSLKDLNQGYLDQYYYETCIMHEPHTDTSEKCYSLLEESVFASNPFFQLNPSYNPQLAERLNTFRRQSRIDYQIEEPLWMQRDSQGEGQMGPGNSQ